MQAPRHLFIDKGRRLVHRIDKIPMPDAPHQLIEARHVDDLTAAITLMKRTLDLQNELMQRQIQATIAQTQIAEQSLGVARELIAACNTQALSAQQATAAANQMTAAVTELVVALGAASDLEIAREARFEKRRARSISGGGNG